MGDIMKFPDTVEEFMEEYKMVDKHEIYSNGTEYVPIFRMKQWFEHCKAQSANAKKYIDADALIAKWEEDIKHIPNASFRAMMQGAINEVSNAPTADVVPIEWIKEQKDKCVPYSITEITLKHLLAEWERREDELY